MGRSLLKKSFLFLSCFFIISCNNLEDGLLSLEVSKDSLQLYFLSLRDKNPTRDQTLLRAKDFYGEEVACEDKKNCVQSCENLFEYNFDEKDCKKLPSALVQRFSSIYTNFENKNFQSFEGFDTSDFKFFLSFSLEPFVKILNNLGASSAQTFLKRLAWDWDIAEIFAQEDLDFILLKTLLSELSLEPISALSENIGEESSFLELALGRQNDFAISLVDGFFKNLCSEEDQVRCVLTQYCLVTENYDAKTLEELAELDFVKDILKKQGSKNLKSACKALKKEKEKEKEEEMTDDKII